MTDLRVSSNSLGILLVVELMGGQLFGLKIDSRGPFFLMAKKNV